MASNQPTEPDQHSDGQFPNDRALPLGKVLLLYFKQSISYIKMF